jgi:alpha-1,2-mannosyltransferase
MTPGLWIGTVLGMTTYTSSARWRSPRLTRSTAGIIGLSRRRGAWLLLGVSVAIYAAVGLVLHQPFHESTRALNYFDLKVYRGAAERVVHGSGVYATPIHDGFGFTYPPFAALVFAPLAGLSITVDAFAVTAINLVLLVWLLRRALLIPMGRSRASAGRPPTGAQAWSLAVCAAAVALWMEPISVTLGYGQINLFIAALVVGDLSRPDDARGKGVGIGLAAALKLTPLFFIPYLLLSGRRRAAAWATSVFAGSVAVAYAAVPGDAARFWTGRLFLDSSRVGGAADTANQSLRGLIARVAPSAHPSSDSYVAIAALALLGLTLAVRASRRGDEAAGFSFAALSALLASPISWTHHWALAVPALLLLARRARAQRSRALTLVTAALVCVGYAYVPEWVGPTHPHGAGSLVTSDPYVLIACGALLAGAVRAAVAARVRRRPRIAALRRLRPATGRS